MTPREFHAWCDGAELGMRRRYYLERETAAAVVPLVRFGSKPGPEELRELLVPRGLLEEFGPSSSSSAEEERRARAAKARAWASVRSSL